MDENPYKSPETKGEQTESGDLFRRLLRSLARISIALCGVLFAFVAASVIVDAIAYLDGMELLFGVGFGLIAVALMYAASRIPR